MPTFRAARNSMAGRHSQATAGGAANIPTPEPPVYDMTYGDDAAPMNWGDDNAPMEW